MSKLAIYLVVWRDAYAKTGWHEKDIIEALAPARIHTVGFLVKKDKEKIVLVGSWDFNECNGGFPIAIPKGWIERMEKISYV